MKRYLALILALVLSLGLLSGCNTTEPDITGKPTTTTTTTTTATTTSPSGNTEIAPAMWRVTGNNGETLYLFGTIHVGDERSQKAMELISSTFDSCDALAVEFDVVAYENDIDAMMEDLSQYVYTDGTKIKDHLPEELYNKSVETMKKAKLYNAMLDYYNVALWSQYIDQAALELTSDLLADYGMDSMLLDNAYDKSMEILNVESASFQMSLLNSFSDELYILLMESTLEYFDEYGKDLEKLYSTWLSGDFDALTKLLNEEDYTGLTDEEIALLKDYNYKLLDERNVGMGDKAIEYLESGKTVFFAVGAAHMTGETGLVNRLTQEGYTVERVYFTKGN